MKRDAYFVRDKVNKEDGGEEDPQEDEDLGSKGELAEVERDFSLPCGLMMKVATKMFGLEKERW